MGADGDGDGGPGKAGAADAARAGAGAGAGASASASASASVDGEAAPRRELALFPLHSVLFPDGLLQLKIFEARYLDLMSECLRGSEPFGAIALRRGREARLGRSDDDRIELERVGTLAELIEVDASAPGILHVRCRGTRRFELHSQTQRANGLWVGEVTVWPEEEPTPPAPATAAAVRTLREAVASLKTQGIEPVLEPCRYDSAAWVADRWCELLPFSLATRQRLLELPDGAGRLAIVTAFLRNEGVIGV